MRRIQRAMWIAAMVAAAACVIGVADVRAATATPEGCRKMRLHGKKDEATACFEALAKSGDPYMMAEGYWGLQDWKKAMSEFDTAIAMPNSPAEWRVREGRLFHERFNDAEAAKSFGEALGIDPKNAGAYLGMAMVSAEGFEGKTGEYIAKAIAADPKLLEAHEFAANQALEAAKPEDAVKEADIAIGLAPYSGAPGATSDALDAMAVRAAVDVLADKNADADAWLAKIKAVNAGYGEAYAMVGHHLVLNRRYEEGVAYYRKAIAAEPDLWSAHSELGINLMRLGQEDEPKSELELAYNNGYTDAATSNSLKLLDSYKNFETFKDATTILRLKKNEAALLRPYFEAELHKVIATYSTKYGMKLDGPVQLEVYPDHEDFAVRTMGMPGLGALGVTFGQVVAMDSPSGRKPGDFNWGSTMWHELSHVFILTATKHRVPRWFTEGLAVHEEGMANPEWANRLTPEVLMAIKGKKLLPVAEMDQGFIFPDYPEQVIVSYWQAGTICDFIHEKWGDDALMGMVHSFAALKTTPEAISENLKVSAEEFDKQYGAWIEKRTGATVANFNLSQLKMLVKAADAKNDDAVIATAPEVIRLYPEYVGDANAYDLLALAQLNKGDKQGAMDTLVAYKKIGGESPVALKKLAELQKELGHPADAAATLDKINYIYPEDEGLHRELGELWLAQGNKAGAVREYTAVLALNPLDKASANYDLARAYMAAGDKAKAEESVLAALEVAPGFKPAQKLLLELNAGESSK